MASHGLTSRRLNPHSPPPHAISLPGAFARLEVRIQTHPGGATDDPGAATCQPPSPPVRSLPQGKGPLWRVAEGARAFVRAFSYTEDEKNTDEVGA